MEMITASGIPVGVEDDVANGPRIAGFGGNDRPEKKSRYGQSLMIYIPCSTISMYSGPLKIIDMVRSQAEWIDQACVVVHRARPSL